MCGQLLLHCGPGHCWSAELCVCGEGRSHPTPAGRLSRPLGGPPGSGKPAGTQLVDNWVVCGQQCPVCRGLLGVTMPQPRHGPLRPHAIPQQHSRNHSTLINLRARHNTGHRQFPSAHRAIFAAQRSHVLKHYIKL